MFRNNEESRPIISLGRRSDPYTLCSDSEDDFEEIEFDKAVFERQFKYDYEPSRMKTIKRKLGFCLLFTAFIGILGTILYYYFSRQVIQLQRRIKNAELNVKTDGGFVRGILEDDIFVFKGIPYAKPPHRWKPPSRCGWNDCWNATFQASEFGERCAQARFNTDREDVEAIGSEDCLFINVWTPSTAGDKLPVMVYVHGGGLLSSSGNDDGLYPTPDTIKEMKIVGVSLNYRLGVFGFLALDVLSNSASENTSGNYGFMDQILALLWVRENIAQFGGDPSRVTLLGQGSGGTSVLALLVSPMAKGLFHRAIALSPSADIMKTSSEAAKDNEVLLSNANCIGNATFKLQCLHSLSPLELFKASPWNGYHYQQKDFSRNFPTKGIFDDAIAVIDGFIIPASPANSIKSNKFNGIPLILGNTAQEIDDRPSKAFNYSSLEQFKAYAKTKLSPFLNPDISKLDSIFNLYNITSNKSAQFFYTTMVSDIREVCPVEYLAITATRHLTSPVYRYVVTNTPSHDINLQKESKKIKGSKYSFHMWDLIAFYGFPKGFNYHPSQRDNNFMKNLRTEFKYFIQNGKVKSNTWLKHPKTTAIFSNKGLEILPKIYHQNECLFWLKNGFAPYAWVN